jgi:hypothetical protein
MMPLTLAAFEASDLLVVGLAVAAFAAALFVLSRGGGGS